VEALARLADDPRATNVIVAGGEVLTCDAWEADPLQLAAHSWRLAELCREGCAPCIASLD